MSKGTKTARRSATFCYQYNWSLSVTSMHQIILPLHDNVSHHQTLPSQMDIHTLQINGITIVCEIQESLQHAAMTPDYCDYMCKKHQWIVAIAKMWIKNAIWWVVPQDWPTLQKFLDDWLTLWGSKSAAQPDSDITCPLCHQAPETFWYFLKCQHP